MFQIQRNLWSLLKRLFIRPFEKNLIHYSWLLTSGSDAFGPFQILNPDARGVQYVIGKMFCERNDRFQCPIFSELKMRTQKHG